jgi:hypothetical protein
LNLISRAKPQDPEYAYAASVQRGIGCLGFKLRQLPPTAGTVSVDGFQRILPEEKSLEKESDNARGDQAPAPTHSL